MMRRLQNKRTLSGDDDDDDSPSRKTTQHDHSSLSAVTFDDVAGIDASLRELSDVVAQIRNPAAFARVGAVPPRGVLLYGPPGSGKTLLAKAVAGELSGGGGGSVDCFVSCAGSEFVDTYVGRGAARVRGLFRGAREEARRNYECKMRSRRERDGGGGSGRSGRGLSEWLPHIVGGQKTRREGTEGGSGSDESVNDRADGFPTAIIFIDEIDALAKRRDAAGGGGFGGGGGGGAMGGGCDEREQTLNQLLAEMDGFDTTRVVSSSSHNASSSKSLSSHPRPVVVIVIAATNRPEVLDPAVLRPGRFDRHVAVPLPDAYGREAILRVHARNVRLDNCNDDDVDHNYRGGVDLRALAFGETNDIDDTDGALSSSSPTYGFSGADLKNVINEAALLAVRSGSEAVTQEHLVEAVDKVRRMVTGGRRPGMEAASVMSAFLSAGRWG